MNDYYEDDAIMSDGVSSDKESAEGGVEIRSYEELANDNEDTNRELRDALKRIDDLESIEEEQDREIVHQNRKIAHQKYELSSVHGTIYHLQRELNKANLGACSLPQQMSTQHRNEVASKDEEIAALKAENDRLKREVQQLREAETTRGLQDLSIGTPMQKKRKVEEMDYSMDKAEKDICPKWQETGRCRHGKKCPGAHPAELGAERRAMAGEFL